MLQRFSQCFRELLQTDDQAIQINGSLIRTSPFILNKSFPFFWFTCAITITCNINPAREQPTIQMNVNSAML